MKKKYKTSQKILISEIDFKISIHNDKLDYWEYKSILTDAVNGTYNSYSSNLRESSAQQFIQHRLKKIFDNRQTVFFINNYSEYEGSLIISFSIFIFTTALNYGQLRESIDYLREDLNYFLNDSFPSKTFISVSYDENVVIEDTENDRQADAYLYLKNEYNKLKKIVLLIGILAVGFSCYALYQLENIVPPNIDEDKMKSMIRFEIEKMQTNELNKELLFWLRAQKENEKKQIETKK